MALKFSFNPLTGNFDYVNGPIALDDISDVTITAPANNNILVYDSASSTWVNAPSGTGLTGFVLTAPSTAAQNTIQPTAAVVPLTVKAPATGTPNITEWYKTSGALSNSIASTGRFDAIIAGGAGVTVETGLSLSSPSQSIKFGINNDYGSGIWINKTTPNLSNFAYFSSPNYTFVNSESSADLSSGLYLGVGGAYPFRIFTNYGIGIGNYASTLETSPGIFNIATSNYIGIGTKPSFPLHVVGASDVKQTVFIAHSAQVQNITEWQTSSGTTTAYVEKAGLIKSSGRKQATVTKTANYTATINDEIIVMNGTTLTLTLPAATASGLTLTVKNINTSALTIDGNASETIDGQLTQTIIQWGAIKLHDYGSGTWAII